MRDVGTGEGITVPRLDAPVASRAGDSASPGYRLTALMPGRTKSSKSVAPGEDEGSGQNPRVLVSVLTPVLNEEAEIEASVRSMQAQRLDGEIELLFIDGGSSDRTREILAGLAGADPRIKLLENPWRRTPHALNIGLHEARGEFVARMDAHARYPDDYLRTAIRRLRRGDVEWVCGPQVPWGDGEWSSRVALALASPLGTGGSQRWPGERPAEAGDGTYEDEDHEEEVAEDSGVFTGVWRRSTLEQHGGWDEGWPINQDCELLARVHDAGGRVVVLPQMAARYVPRNSLRRLAAQYLEYGQYRAKTSRRHPATLRPSHLLVPAVPLTLLLAVVAPGRIRRWARAGASLYALAILAATRAAAREGDRGDVARLPVVFLTLHVMWGAGYLYGSLRHGPPFAGVAARLRTALGRARGK
jgi:succinoglycan biosynthesis protein ExoA